LATFTTFELLTITAMKKQHLNLASTGITIFLFALLAAMPSCKTEPPTDLTKEVLIPKPVSVAATGKRFELTSATVVHAEGTAEVTSIANYLASGLSQITGFSLSVETGSASSKRAIHLALGLDASLGDEGYELSIDKDRVTITASQPAGLFYGVQTLLQLVPLPPQAVAGQSDKFQLPTGTIRDYPRYAWRGSMLDVSRHFFSVEDVKRYIDLIAAYKMNILHLHLTDDQGWRIEIKSWPNLAVHGGSTQVGGGKGGYYTQEQYKDIQAYAAGRFITIVPEIDMPSHINAALASYGSLNAGTVVPEEGKYTGAAETQGIPDGKQKPTDLYTGIQVGWSTLSLSRPATMQFVNDVIRELAEITTGPYIHIGGDEAHVTKKEDYIDFINRFSYIVKANGKKMIGWEEIAQANIDGNAIAQYWHSADYAALAADKGAKIILSPSTRVYLDMQYDSATRLGLHWAAYIEVDDAYTWDPDTLVSEISKDQILGVEAPLWTETVVTMDDIEYMVFPRLPGIAEIAWSPAGGRNWEEYKLRLAAHGPRMKAKGIDFYRSPRVPWVE
jgi:hexosaminidase